MTDPSQNDPKKTEEAIEEVAAVEGVVIVKKTISDDDIAYVDHDPSGITINPNPATPGEAAYLTVTLSGRTTNTGKVDIATNNAGYFSTLPQTVVFPAGYSLVTVQIGIAATWGSASVKASTPIGSVQTSVAIAENNG